MDDWKFWAPLIATTGQLVVCILSYRLQLRHMQLTLAPAKVQVVNKMPWYQKFWPILVMAVLMVGAWLPYFTAGEVEVPMDFWGSDGLAGATIPIEQLKNLKVVMNGANFTASIRRKYRVAAIAFHNTGEKDVEDVEVLKSNAQDIRDGEITMLIPVTEAFRAEFNRGERGTNYDAVLVPKETSMDNFSTLRQAKALGVKVVSGRGALP